MSPATLKKSQSKFVSLDLEEGRIDGDMERERERIKEEKEGWKGPGL